MLIKQREALRFDWCNSWLPWIPGHKSLGANKESLKSLLPALFAVCFFVTAEIYLGRCDSLTLSRLNIPETNVIRVFLKARRKEKTQRFFSLYYTTHFLSTSIRLHIPSDLKFHHLHSYTMKKSMFGSLKEKLSRGESDKATDKSASRSSLALSNPGPAIGGEYSLYSGCAALTDG